MANLLTTFSVGFIVLVLVVCLPALVKFVNWIIKIVKQHNQNQQNAINTGRVLQQEDDAEEERFEKGEARIGNLEAREDKLETLLINQQKQIDTLIASDNLNIKYNIKRTWEKVCRQHLPIDAYDLDLLESRYALYAARGGNSWAKKMMEEIRKVATRTEVAPLRDEHKYYHEDEEDE